MQERAGCQVMGGKCNASGAWLQQLLQLVAGGTNGACLIEGTRGGGGGGGGHTHARAETSERKRERGREKGTIC